MELEGKSKRETRHIDGPKSAGGRAQGSPTNFHQRQEHNSKTVAEQVVERSKTAFDGAGDNAIATFNLIAYDPVTNLSRAYAPLSAPQATGVGIVFALVSATMATLGAYLLVLGMLSGTIIGKFYQPTFGHVITFFLCFLICFFSIAASHFAVRKFFGDADDYDIDVFVAGVTTLPFGVAMLPAGIIGLASSGIGIGLSVFAFCYAVMILYASLSDISDVPEHIVTPAVPAIAVLSIWLAKTLLFLVVF